MNSVKVNIAPEIIDWLMTNVQVEKLGNALLEQFGLWKTGEKNPTFNQIEDISKKTNIPFGYFFLERPPIEVNELVEYRTVDSDNLRDPSRNLTDTIDSMKSIQDWMRDYARDTGRIEPAFVGMLNIDSDSIEAAKKIRSVIGLEDDWYKKSNGLPSSFKIIRNRCEEAGVIVMMNGVVGQNTRRPLDTKEFRAFTLIDEMVPLIFINTTDSEVGKLFSIVHELVHIFLGTSSLYNQVEFNNTSISKLEILCNSIAAEILVPTSYFTLEWNQDDSDTKERIKNLASFFKTSRQVICRKALDNGLISKQVYFDLMKVFELEFLNWLQERKTNKSSGGNYYNTAASRFDFNLIRALNNSAKEGRTQYGDVYRLTGTNRTTFAKLVETMGAL